MKFLIYCQHVLGIGHLARILEITRALQGNAVTLVLGGPDTEIPVPKHVQVVRLPGLKMDEEFSGLFPVDPVASLEGIKQTRKKQLLELFASLQPDVLLIELFPFGRYGFRFELDPLLARAKEKDAECMIACSVRDILVERDNKKKFEQRVIERLNGFFDLLLVHGDPSILPLDATFSRMGDIEIPVRYTGYICQTAQPGEGERIRNALDLSPDEYLLVASAGSGSVGYSLLKSTLRAYDLLRRKIPCRLQLFTGPYLNDSRYDALVRQAGDHAAVDRFTDNYPAWLSVADLSVSMGGYNTTMNVIAARCPALIYPFRQNHEQRMRAEKMKNYATLNLLSDQDLEPERLAEKMLSMLHGQQASLPSVRLDGVQTSTRILLQAGNGAP